MVRSLLPVLVGAVFGCSCLVSNPPDYDSTGHRPAVESRDPAGWFIELNLDEVTPSSLVFHTEIWDGDEDDVLRHRCFLDFRPDGEPRCGVANDYAILDTTPAGMRTAQCRPFRSPLAAGCHRVTMVITDGEWHCPDQTGCAGIVEPGNAALAEWWILAYDSTVGIGEVLMSDCLTAQQNPLQLEETCE